MIDLPAPVSPESTLKPAPSGSVSDSMIAKFRMRSSVSIALAFVAVEQAAPAQLLAHAWRRSCPSGKRTIGTGSRRPADHERLADGEGGADLAVHRHQKLVGPIFRPHVTSDVGRQHERPHARACARSPA